MFIFNAKIQIIIENKTNYILRQIYIRIIYSTKILLWCSKQTQEHTHVIYCFNRSHTPESSTRCNACIACRMCELSRECVIPSKLIKPYEFGCESVCMSEYSYRTNHFLEHRTVLPMTINRSTERVFKRVYVCVRVFVCLSVLAYCSVCSESRRVSACVFECIQVSCLTFDTDQSPGKPAIVLLLTTIH